MNIKIRAFTIVELLTVIAVISILVGLTIPALNEARWMAREMTVKADLKNYELGLNNFYNDLGFYPSSTSPLISPRYATVYDPALPPAMSPAIIPEQGAHILYESLVGMDRRGYQKDHFYGIDLTGNFYTIVGGRPVSTTRSDQYITLKDEKIGSMYDIIPDLNRTIDKDAAYNYDQLIIDDLDAERPMPILYYRAHENRTLLYSAIDPTIPLIYQYEDNIIFTSLSPGFSNPTTASYDFAQYIYNPKTALGNFPSPSAQPFNSETFLLISAGRDGIFGPNPEKNFKIDDISNFERIK